VEIELWDTPGLKSDRSTISAYFREANGVFLVYDIAKPETYRSVKRWLRDHVDQNIVIIIVGNKSDLGHSRAVSRDEAIAYTFENAYFFQETSALDSTNVSVIFTNMTTGIFHHIQPISPPRTWEYQPRPNVVSLRVTFPTKFA
jgi:Ras-related protein Rab-11A